MREGKGTTSLLERMKKKCIKRGEMEMIEGMYVILALTMEID